MRAAAPTMATATRQLRRNSAAPRKRAVAFGKLLDQGAGLAELGVERQDGLLQFLEAGGKLLKRHRFTRRCRRGLVRQRFSGCGRTLSRSFDAPS